MSPMVQNTSIHLIDRGSGPPTLLLHGVPDSADMWEEVIARLEGRYRCLAPDLPGMGRSGVPAGFDCSLEQMAGFIDALVTAIGIDEPLNLVVHDFGGPYGLAWAVRHPAKVRSVAIMNTSFSSSYRWHLFARIWRTPVLGELSMALTSRSLWRGQMRQNAPAMPAAYIERTYDASIAKPEVRRMILRMYRATNPDNFKGWEDELLKLTARVPALVLWGDRDPFISPDRAGRFGTGKVEHIAGYGHWLPIEAPALVAERLLAFFAQ